MSATLLCIHPENPEQRKIDTVVKTLKKGGIIIYPTDSVYGIACDLFQSKAIEKLARIKGIKKDKGKFSIVCRDISQIAEYVKSLDNAQFKLLKKSLPGPYTYILAANSKVPKILNTKKKTIGVRIPNHPIPLSIIEQLGNPIITTSLKDEDEIIEYTTDPSLIHEDYHKLVDIVIDGGYGHNVATTVIDYSEHEPVLIREGLGELIV